MTSSRIRVLPLVVAVVVCAVAGCLLTLWVELVMHAATLTFTYPPLSAFLLLLVILWVYNPLVRRITPALVLSPLEGLITYCTVSVGTGLASTRYGMFLPALLAAPAYYAGPENDLQTFVAETPGWLRIDSTAARSLYEGVEGPHAIPWGAWLLPIGSWTLLMIALAAVLFVVGLLLSRQWIEHERLAFPLAQIPLEIAGETSQHSVRGAGRASALLLWGVVLAAAWRVTSGARHYFPGLPLLEVRSLDLLPKDASPPWQAAGPISLTVMPAVTALAFLAPTDVTGSIWGFYLARKLALLVITGLGLQPLGLREPIDLISWQSVGAYVVMGIVLVARGWSGTAAEHSGRHRRTLLTAVFAGMGLLVWWSSASGMSLSAAAVFWSLFVCNSVVLARMAAEGGVMWLLGPMRADRVVKMLARAGVLGASSNASLAFHSLHTRVYHGLMLPNLMQGLKIGEDANIDSQRIAKWMFAGSLVALVISVPLSIALTSGEGGLALSPLLYGSWARQPFVEATEQLSTSSEDAVGALSASGLGGLCMSGLLAAQRTVHPWAPNPLGYLVGVTVESVWLDWIWFSVFVAWLLKKSCLRLFGHRAHTTLRKALIGVFAGDVAGIGIWLAIDALLGTRGHWLFP